MVACCLLELKQPLQGAELLAVAFAGSLAWLLGELKTLQMHQYWLCTAMQAARCYVQVNSIACSHCCGVLCIVLHS